jgi:DNA-binding MarR family transcriptional regulator
MDQTINIGTTINLPDLVKSRLLIQANSGGGKSAIARVIMEESYGKIPWVVMDIDGEYYTLKEVHGDIIVIGGQHADVPISMELAKQLPKFIIENQLSAVLDISDMDMGERIRFARLFLESLMQLPQQYWTALLVFLEECHKLAGEQDKYESGPAVKDLLSRGRKRGYCGIPITQRISKLHKDVAAECNNKFIGRTYLDIDMDRAAKELGFSKMNDRMKLRDLKPGYFYAFGTSIEPHEVHEVKIKTPQSKMPQAGTNMNITAKAPTGKLISILAKLNDELIKTEPKAESCSKPDILVKEYKDEIAALKKHNEEQQSQYRALLEVVHGFQLAADAAKVFLEEGVKPADLRLPGGYQTEEINYHGRPYPDHNIVIPTKEKIQKIPAFKNQGELKASNGTLGKGEITVLSAIAQHQKGVTRIQLTVLTGYKRSSRDAFIQRLSAKDLITISDDRITATGFAIQTLGDSYKPLPKGKALREYWLNNLPGGEKPILEILMNAYPKSVDREEITNRTEYKRSSRDAFLQRLVAKELVNITERGMVKASDNLFN